MIRQMMLAVCSLLPAVLAADSGRVAHAQESLNYVVSFEDAASHYVDVTLLVPSPRRGSFEVMMPVWTPGSYLVREYSRNIDRIEAFDAAGRLLPIEKVTKNVWSVVCDPGGDVKVKYRLYCREMSVRTNWVDADLAVLNGAATYLSIPEARNRPHRVQFQLPPGWDGVETALNRVGDESQTFEASGLDELVDSPVLCGNLNVESFEVAGVPHAVVNSGDFRLWDTTRAAADVKRIVEQQHEFWGSVPYPHYKFLNVIAEGRGGLEHDNSTLVMTSRWNYRDEDKYRDWLSLMSHEFFHTWNVRRLRPAGLADYDFNAENYTRGLWVAEGITTYYQNVMLIRAGLIDQKEYLKRLSRSIESLQKNPGRGVQSLSDSSFDAWVKYYRPDENSANTRVSYYVKGGVVAFLLDARIRELTSNQKSLDDAMRLLYERHAGGDGFTDADFGRTVAEVSGTDMTDWLTRHIYTTDELDYQPALDWFGLTFPTSKTADASGSEASKEATTSNKDHSAPPTANDSESAANAGGAAGDSEDEQKRPEPWLGVKLSSAGDGLTISGVEHGSPAHAAGLNVGDEILAFNDYRASSSNWSRQLKQLGVGETVTVLLARRGLIRTLEVEVHPEPEREWSLKPIKQPSEEQEIRLQQWLGIAGPDDEPETEE